MLYEKTDTPETIKVFKIISKNPSLFDGLLKVV